MSTKPWSDSKLAEVLDKNNFRKKFIKFLQRKVQNPLEFLQNQHMNDIMKKRLESIFVTDQRLAKKNILSIPKLSDNMSNRVWGTAMDD